MKLHWYFLQKNSNKLTSQKQKRSGEGADHFGKKNSFRLIALYIKVNFRATLIDK